MLLNNDTKVANDWLDRAAFQCLQSSTDRLCAIYCARHIYKDGVMRWLPMYLCITPVRPALREKRESRRKTGVDTLQRLYPEYGQMIAGHVAEGSADDRRYSEP